MTGVMTGGGKPDTKTERSIIHWTAAIAPRDILLGMKKDECTLRN
jgi:hypothetical protein